MPHPRLLVAGIGNIFHGDDAFGVQVAQLLARGTLPDGVEVRDFGIRGLDLALALTEGYDGAILIDTAMRGGAPGTLYVIEPELPGEPGAAEIDPHGLDPAKVLRFACRLGEVCPGLRVVGCEPLTFGTEDELATGLSEPVARAVEPAVSLVETLIGIFLDTASEKAGHSQRPCTNSG
jgi:hydrogenase maturation protease